ncbi:MAG: hypothetical protein QM582_18840 [Micropruina sp.]|uniref:type I-G CRISPR-associated protein, Cas3-extension family n=1 Tax=Micropruina sp. TaxID=2737536 RepID=UPI0039E561FB
MNEVRMPALTGDSPLGILAAIGVLRLLSEFTEARTRLRWNRSDLTAVLCGPHDDIDAVVADLAAIVAGIDEGASLPGVGAGFPPPGAAPDGLRVPQARLSSATQPLVRDMSDAQRGEALRWLSSLVTDLAADDKGRVAISQFAAPSGKQSMATMLDKPLEQIRKEPDHLRQAMVGWRRVAGVTGEYLDHRAMWDATEDGAGSPSMRGVPGATWLALMSYPLLRTTVSSRRRPLSSGWHAVKVNGSRPYDELRLPVWEQPLGTAGITALIEHPALSKVGGRPGPAGKQDDLVALGIVHVCRARRYQPPGGKSAGVLTPVRS